jgi:hypothetical protein
MWTLDAVAAALGPAFEGGAFEGGAFEGGAFGDRAFGDRAPSVGFLCEDTLELATETIGFGKRS